MARTPLLHRLLKLTSIAHKAGKENADEIEFTEQHFYSRRKFMQSSAMATIAATALAGCTKMVDSVVNDNDSSNAGTANPSIAIIGAGIAGLNAGQGSFQAVERQIVTKLENGTIGSFSVTTGGKIAANEIYANVPVVGAEGVKAEVESWLETGRENKAGGSVK